MPCNGTKDKEVMGNLNTQSWEELWSSLEADAVRAKGATATAPAG
ncbi:MAG: SPASM domain-containing protein [Faecalibacterium prausnitzii]